MIKCKICGIERNSLPLHIRKVHKLSTIDYRCLYPDAELFSIEYKDRIVQNVKNQHRNPEYQRVLSDTMKRCSNERWKDKVYRKVMSISSSKKILSTSLLGPSGEEIDFFNKLDIHCPNVFRHTSINKRYVHDSLGSINPDIKVIGKKKFIEYFGSFWHANPLYYKADDSILGVSVSNIWDKDRFRLERLSNAGYDWLVIWDNEWFTNPEWVILRCIEFALDNITVNNHLDVVQV